MSFWNKLISVNKSPRTEISKSKLTLQAAITESEGAIKVGNLKTVKSMLNLYPDLALTKYGEHDCLDYTLLHTAALYGQKEIAELLLDHKAEVNAKTNYDITPLHAAARGGSKEVTDLLLARGADINAKNKRGETPLDKALETGKKDVIHLLLANKAEVDVHTAAEIGDLNLIKKMIIENPDVVFSRNRRRRTPLQCACIHHKEVVELLLAHRAEVNIKDKDGWTPLHIAAGCGNKDIVELLLAHKAEVNALNNISKTPLYEAANLSYPDVVELLRQHGGHE